MVKSADRDLLVISKNALTNDDALQQEIEILNYLLPGVEVLQNIANSSEIFDLNRCRTFKTSQSVSKQLQKTLRSFVFICNKN
jgi:hypothetical protein